MPRRIIAVVIGVAFSQIAGATTITNTRTEIAQMAGMWEVDNIQISALANAQYPLIGDGTNDWQYIFPNSSVNTPPSGDGDLHIATAIDSSGTGENGSNTGNSPVITEIINCSNAQKDHVYPSLSGTRVKVRGIFRFYTEHSIEKHFEVHPITEIMTWNGSAFVPDASYRQNITNDQYAAHGYAHSTLVNLVNNTVSITASVLADNNRVVFTYPTPAGAATMNYPEYDGRVMGPLTNDVCSSYFPFLPTNDPVSTAPGPVSPTRTFKCRIVTNTQAAAIAAGLVSNMAVNVNALNRIDMLIVSNAIASLGAGQTSNNFIRPLEFVVLGLKTLGTVAAPTVTFTGTPTNGTPPLAVTFTDTSTGSITNRAWTFGDGGTSNTTATSVQYTYAAAGTNHVTLAVSGLGGLTTFVRSNYIIVGSAAPSPPTAIFSGSPTNGTEALVVTFSDTSTGNITNRFWDFGNGTTNVTTNSVTRTYASGTNDVTLVASGPDGVSTNTKPNYITVLSAFEAWQVQYFGSSTNDAAAPNADPDGDGCDNLCEFLPGTDPTNGASYFHITSVDAVDPDVDPDVVLTWATGLGRTNVVQSTIGLPDGSYSNNFSDTSPLIILPPGSGSTTTNYSDPGGATNTPANYYRIRLVP